MVVGLTVVMGLGLFFLQSALFGLQYSQALNLGLFRERVMIPLGLAKGTLLIGLLGGVALIIYLSA